MASLDNNERPTISKDTIKRLAKDVRDIINNPLTDSGIYYLHSEDDILSGQAMIIGPKNTPYEGGYYIFEFKFPVDYPHTPPTVKYYTNDGVTRFNPNLYKSGKVCISILNTWRGPQWTGCQSITSILLCLCSAVLNEEPLLNEPGIKRDHEDYQKYNEIVQYKNFDVAIADMLEDEGIKKRFPRIHIIMCEHFLENYDDILKLLDRNSIKEKVITTHIYKMRANIAYLKTKNRIIQIYNNLKN